MYKQVAVKILLLYGIYYIKADIQELTSPTVYLLPSANKINNNYLPPIKEERAVQASIGQEKKSIKGNLGYQHNRPKVIDDPLPMKVDYVNPVDINFDKTHNRPILQGALITALYFNAYDTRKRLLFEPTPNNVNKVKAINKSDAHAKRTHDDINAESSIESKKYIIKPDVVPINFFSDEATKFKLFNCDDDTQLSGSAPVVIYKPGDDITFSTDTTVIDDYDHMFAKDNINNSTKSGAQRKPTKKISKTKEQSVAKKEVATNKKDITTTSASTVHAATTGDSYSSEATKHSIVHEASESVLTGHGYIYDKPKIPFTF